MSAWPPLTPEAIARHKAKLDEQRADDERRSTQRLAASFRRWVTEDRKGP